MDAEEKEQAAVDDVIRRLTKKYPEFSGEKVETVVRGAYKELSDKPLRDYIPVLVEHAFKTQLRTELKQRKH